jgi:hypothetical protein
MASKPNAAFVAGGLFFPITLFCANTLAYRRIRRGRSHDRHVHVLQTVFLSLCLFAVVMNVRWRWKKRPKAFIRIGRFMGALRPEMLNRGTIILLALVPWSLPFWVYDVLPIRRRFGLTGIAPLCLRSS